MTKQLTVALIATLLPLAATAQQDNLTQEMSDLAAEIRIDMAMHKCKDHKDKLACQGGRMIAETACTMTDYPHACIMAEEFLVQEDKLNQNADQ